MNRLESDKVDAMMSEAQETAQQQSNAASSPTTKEKQSSKTQKVKDEIQFDDFAKIDLRVAEIVNAEHVEGDAFDPEFLIKSAQNCDVIVNALNPPYPNWSKDLPVLTENIILAAKSSGATIMLPGNVYNYGEGMPPLLSEETSMAPTSKKGRLRQEMESTYANAAGDGVQTIILRAGDFIEREKTGNWFDSHITKDIDKSRVMYPGPLDRAHAWAYLPDMASAMVALAEKRDQLAPFEQFGFPGFSS